MRPRGAPEDDEKPSSARSPDQSHQMWWSGDQYALSVPCSRIRQNSGDSWAGRRSARSLGDFGYIGDARLAALAR